MDPNTSDWKFDKERCVYPVSKYLPKKEIQREKQYLYGKEIGQTSRKDPC